MKITKTQCVKVLSACLIILPTIVAIYALLPLFSDGIPMSGDLPLHYGVAYCYYHEYSWSWPSAWCSASQAGIAPSQGYAILHQHLISLLSIPFSLDSAFKISLVILYFSLPIAGWVLFLLFNEPLAGSFAYALLLLSPGNSILSGFEKIFLFGSIAHSFGSAWLLFSLAAVMWFFRTPSRASYAGLVVLSVLFFLAHASLFSLFPLLFLLAALLHWKTAVRHCSSIALYILTSSLLVQYWLLPFLSKKSYFFSYAGGAIDPFYLKWLTIPYLILVGLGIAAAIKERSSSSQFLVSSQFLLYYTGLLAFIALAGSFAPGTSYFNLLHLSRVLTEGVTAGFLLISLASARAVDWTFSMTRTPTPRTQNPLPHTPYLVPLLTFVLLTALFITNISEISHARNAVYTSSMKNFPDTLEHLSLFENATGRILLKDPEGKSPAPVGLSHVFAASPAYSNKEFLGLEDSWYQVPDYTHVDNETLFTHPLHNLTMDRAAAIMEALNIQYLGEIPRHEGDNADLYYAGPLGFKFSKTGVAPSYFSYPVGTLISQEYQKTRASAVLESSAGGELLFKVRHFPNWKATIDGKPASPAKDFFGLITLIVPPGRHTVQFFYRVFDTIDILGYLLSLCGLILFIVSLKKWKDEINA